MTEGNNEDLIRIAIMTIHRIDGLRLSMRTLFPEIDSFKDYTHALRAAVQARLNELIITREKEVG